MSRDVESRAALLRARLSQIDGAVDASARALAKRKMQANAAADALAQKRHRLADHEASHDRAVASRGPAVAAAAAAAPVPRARHLAPTPPHPTPPHSGEPG